MVIGVVRETEFDTTPESNVRRRINETSGDDLYSLRLLGARNLDRLVSRERHPSETELGDPVDAAERVASEAQERYHCSVFETKTWEIGRVNWLPETRVSWNWKTLGDIKSVRVGDCDALLVCDGSKELIFAEKDRPRGRYLLRAIVIAQ